MEEKDNMTVEEVIRRRVESNVERMVGELRSNPSARFSYSDWNALIFAILSDPDFRAKKLLLRDDRMVEFDVDIRASFIKFLEKVLRHAGMEDRSERLRVIDSFEFGPRDLEWVSETVDEAMFLYTEAGRNMRIFRNKALQLSLKKMARSGKYGGRITYKKSVVNRLANLEKRLGKSI